MKHLPEGLLEFMLHVHMRGCCICPLQFGLCQAQSCQIPLPPLSYGSNGYQCHAR